MGGCYNRRRGVRTVYRSLIGSWTMRVVVTGAAGNLGKATWEALLRAGHDVVPTGRREKPDMPGPLRVANLLDREAMYPLMDGADVIIHNGNHIDFLPKDPQLIFGENMLMNINALQAAIDCGVKRVIFASSVQVIASVPRLPAFDPDEMPAYLPLDGDSPDNPTNPYALSKQCGERVLQYYVRVFGVQTVSVRWPWIVRMDKFADRCRDCETRHPWCKLFGWSYLSFADGGELNRVLAETDLPGYRVYLPASKGHMIDRPAADLIREMYPDVLLKKPLEKIDSLVDISRIERETGWSPRD